MAQSRVGYGRTEFRREPMRAPWKPESAASPKGVKPELPRRVCRIWLWLAIAPPIPKCIKNRRD